MSKNLNYNGDTFAVWLKKVNSECASMIGIEADDLPDWDSWNAWNSDTSPNQAAIEAIENACDDMGMDPEDLDLY